MNRQQIESELLARPFDHALRLSYARLLAEAGDNDLALQQIRWVTQAQPSAPAWKLQARCELALGERSQALTSYRQARSLPDFSADPLLEELELATQAAGPRLRVVDSDGSLREHAAPAERDSIRFADVVGLDELKRSLRMQIIEPFLKPGLFARFRKQAGGGVLLYGPPGCGKTMMARAVAGECRAEFITVGISDIVSMWIGESEQQLRSMFERARARKPAVLFFDELDALAFSRSKAQSEHTRRLVNEFLSQLDGMGSDNQSILMLAATNMPWDVDGAIKRPGRFARQIFVPPPDAMARAHMLREKLHGVPSEPLDTVRLAERTPLYSGADVDGLIDLAKELALAEMLDSGQERPLRMSDFLAAADRLTPSTRDWLETARNLVRYGGADNQYRDLERYLKEAGH